MAKNKYKNTITKKQKETLLFWADIAARDMVLRPEDKTTFKRFRDRIQDFLRAAADLFLIEYSDMYDLQADIFAYCTDRYTFYQKEYNAA